jgi:hypothetical protein
LKKLKERYLKDGEFHQEKGFRKKQFRWKNLNGIILILNPKDMF